MNEKVTARYPQWLWLGVALLLSQGIYSCAVPLWNLMTPRGPDGFFWGMGVCFAVVSIWLGICLARTRIEADSSGLRWRKGTGKWQGIPWEDVIDFYDARGAESKYDKAVVVFRDQRKLTLSKTYESYLPLRNAIVRQAIHSGKDTWESRTLTGKPAPTSATATRGMIGLLIANFIGLAGMMGWMSIWVPIQKIQRARETGPVDVWTWAAVAVAEVVFLPLMILGLIGAITLARTERPRAVHFNDEGFTVEEQGKQPWNDQWEEITSIQQRWNGMCIETPHGVFYATTCLNHFRTFRDVLNEHLPEHLKQARSEVPVVVQGDTQTFTYVYSGYRAILMLPIGLGLAMPLVRTLYYFLGLEFRAKQATIVDSIFEVCLFGGLVLLGIWGLWRMHAASIEISDVGITQVGLSGITRLRWSDIERGRATGSDSLTWFELSGAGKRVRWWMGIPNGKLLNEEVARRLPHVPLDWSINTKGAE